MKVIVTTSNRYMHLVPVFIYLYNKYWGWPCTIVGYDAPPIFGNLPKNITFHSLGVQGSPKEFSTDLFKYFETQPDFFVWLMEDTFIKGPVNTSLVSRLFHSMEMDLRPPGKMCLTNESMKRGHQVTNNFFAVFQDSKYRLSTQPAIWNKKFLLKYLTPGLSPWEFETQESINDGWVIMGMVQNVIHHNEGVRKHNIHDLNLSGLTNEDIKHIKTLL